MKNKLYIKENNKLFIYQGKSGKIEFRGDLTKETIWGTQKQLAELFNVDIRTVNEHLKNIFKTNELKENLTIRKFRIVQKEGKRNIKREINFYNLDAIISVGYRVNSKKATKFRIWATKTIKQHLLRGYTINKKQIGKDYEKFLKSLSEVKSLLHINNKIKTEDILELINVFAKTWVSLEAYDKDIFPKTGKTKKKVTLAANKLNEALNELKNKLIFQKQATSIFAQPRNKDALEGIVGNIMQTAFGKDVYPTLEEKAAHLLYFIIKSHPFVDGNKRSAAFAFVWFLQQTGLLRASLTPEALTALTLFIAESKPKDKNKMIGLVLLLLKKY